MYVLKSFTLQGLKEADPYLPSKDGELNHRLNHHYLH